MVRAEGAQEASLLGYRDLFEDAPLPIWVFDTETLRFLAVNRAAIKQYGYSEEEFAAMTLADIRPQEDIPALRDDVARQHNELRLWRHCKKDGTFIHVQISARDIMFAGRSARLVHVFDVTARIALEEQLRQSQKMEAIGQLAGGVAHDFNNILMVISSYAELLLRDSHDAHTREDLLAIRSASSRGADLTQKLLAFARKKLTEPTILDVGAIVAEMRNLLRPVLGVAHDVIYAIEPERGRIRADRGAIEQVVMNLVVNARDAMPDGGVIAVAVRDIDIDPEYARRNVGIVPGPHVMLSVADTGVGMDTTTRARVFEPFFTTKEVGRGTGLGLSTVLGIVQQNGGHVHVDSTLGRGSTFSLYFPRL